MATSSSLVVKISADVNDFSRQLDAMTRGVDRAAAKIEKFGQAITLGITVPVTAAAVALAKMAAENEDTGARLERVFGSAASSVNASIQSMMKSVPEANTELQKMAISAQNMNLGLGLAPQKASQVSEAMLKLAGDAAAFAHVPMADALDALERGLAGKTKGLLQFGIAINEADIKERALQMGLLHTGNELTETGTALAAYSLIMERSTRIQGEAARTADQSGKSFAFLKRDLSELADNVSGIVLPSLSELANRARDVVAIFASLDQSTVKTFFGIAAAAAVVGPVIVGLVKLVDVVFKVRAAFVLLAAGGSAAGFFASLAALPFATIVAGIAAITVAVGALAIAYQKLKGAKATDVTGPLANDPALAKAVAGQNIAIAATGTSGANAPTERNPKDALQQMEDTAKRLADAFKHMGDGWEIPDLTDKWVLLLGEAQAQYDEIDDKTSDIANRLRDIISSTSEAAGKQIGRAIDIANLPTSVSNLSVQATKQFGTQALAVDPAKIADVGQAFSTSGLAAAAALDQQSFQMAQVNVEYAGLRLSLEQFGITLGNVSTKAQGAILTLANGIQNFALQLASKLGGSGANASGGRGIGGLLGSAGGFFLGGPAGAAIGNILGTAAGGLIGGLFDHPKKASDAASSSLDTLAKTVDKVTQSITNVPAFFKIQTYRFEAAPVHYVYPPPPTTGGNAPPPGSTQPGSPIPPSTPGDPSTDPKGGSKGNVINLHNPVFNGITDVKAFMKELAFENLKARGTGSPQRFGFAQVPG